MVCLVYTINVKHHIMYDTRTCEMWSKRFLFCQIAMAPREVSHHRA